MRKKMVRIDPVAASEGERNSTEIEDPTPSPLERRERLEQLRALEAGMRIAVARVEHGPFGVDTPADLERARAMLAGTRQE